MIMQFMMIFQN